MVGKWLKWFWYVVMLIIIFIVAIEIYKYPKEFDCYRNECVATTLDNYDECRFVENTGGGLFGAPRRSIYNCDGKRVQHLCIRYEEVKQEISPTILDILQRKCSKLEEKG